MLEQHLVILLMKLAASAALASILGRSSAFLRMLTREERTTQQRLQMLDILDAINLERLTSGHGLSFLRAGAGP